MKPLTLSEFRDALRKGKGRAYLHVRRYGDAGVRKALLEACRRDLRYDSQIENDRSEWTYAILSASAHSEQYLKLIVRALMKSKVSQARHLADLAGQFARRGNEKARQAIRTRFVRRSPGEECELAEALMDADGLDGFLRASDAIGTLISKEDEWNSEYCFFCAKERFGEEKVRAALSEYAKHSSGTRRFAVALKRIQKAAKPGKPPAPTLRQVLQWIETGRSRPLMCVSSFARSANRREIEILFNRMLKETQPEVIYRYLRVFLSRELPRLDQRIFEWARTGNADIHRAAIVALSRVKHETVRSFALARLCPKDGPPDWWGLSLLERNCRKGDGRWIRPLLPQEGDAEVLHTIGINLTGIDVQRDETLVECLLWVYEHTPCSMCRGRATRSLIYLRRAPQWLLREAVHDADDWSRGDAVWALSKRGKAERRKTAQK